MLARRTLPEREWFTLADELAAELGGDDALTVRLLADRAKDRHGLSASYTTITRQLEQWRALGGSQRPRKDSSQLVAVITHAVEPIYAELVRQARAELEPKLAAAEHALRTTQEKLVARDLEMEHLQTERTALSTQVQTLHQDLQTVAEARASLQATLAATQTLLAQASEKVADMRSEKQKLEQTLEQRQAEHQVEVGRLRSRIEALENQNALLIRTGSQENSRYDELLKSIQQLQGAATK